MYLSTHTYLKRSPVFNLDMLRNSRHVASGGAVGAAAPRRFWQIRRRRRAAAARRITTCPPRFLDFATCLTPARTLSISRLKSRVLKLSFLSLKMMVKSSLEFILKFIEPLQRYLLSCQANSANMGRYFCTGQQQL